MNDEAKGIVAEEASEIANRKQSEVVDLGGVVVYSGTVTPFDGSRVMTAPQQQESSDVSELKTQLAAAIAALNAKANG